jgi:hypothetical protein
LYESSQAIVFQHPNSNTSLGTLSAKNIKMVKALSIPIEEHREGHASFIALDSFVVSPVKEILVQTGIVSNSSLKRFHYFADIDQLLPGTAEPLTHAWKEENMHPEVARNLRLRTGHFF